jgi:DNA-binding transcriptional LysR family regulator
MRITIRQIEAFRAVMVYGTVTQAAERLRTSQPSVSRSIQELEEATGLTLFMRVKRRIEPTSAASELYKEVARAFIGMDDIARAAEAIQGLRSGAVRVICFPAFSEGFMAEVFRRFLSRHPKAQLVLETQHTPTIVEAIAAHRFDVGVAGYDLQAAEATSERLTSANHVCVLPAKHALVRKSVIRPADLRDAAFISGDARDLNRQRVDEVFNAAGVSRHSIVEVQSATVICAMVAKGIGVSIVNPFAAVAFRPALVMRPFSAPVPFVATVLRPKHPPLSTLTNALVDVMRKYCAEVESVANG